MVDSYFQVDLPTRARAQQLLRQLEEVGRFVPGIYYDTSAPLYELLLALAERLRSGWNPPYDPTSVGVGANLPGTRGARLSPVVGYW